MDDSVQRARIVDGRLTVERVTRESVVSDSPATQSAAAASAQRALTEEDLDERVLALQDVIRERMNWERCQIVKVVAGYADDCAQRGDDLQKLADELRPDDPARASIVAARSSAFRIRSAVVRDVAEKIETGWGRGRA